MEKELLEKVFKTQVLIYQKLTDIENKVKGKHVFGGGFESALKEIEREIQKVKI